MQQVTLGSNVQINKHQVGLGNVTDDLQLKADQLGVDVCPLVGGMVPENKLPPVGAVQSVNGQVGDVVVSFDGLDGSPFNDDDVALKAKSFRVKAEHTEVQNNIGYTVETTPVLPITHHGIVLESVNLDINQYDWILSYGRLKWYCIVFFPSATNQSKDLQVRSCLIQNGEEVHVNEARFSNNTEDYQKFGYNCAVDTRIPIESINITYGFTLPGQTDFVTVDVKFIGPFVSYPSELIVDDTLRLRDLDVYRDVYQRVYSLTAAEDLQKNKAVVLDESGVMLSQGEMDYLTPAVTSETVFSSAVHNESFSVEMFDDQLYVFYTVSGSESYVKRLTHDGTSWTEQQSFPFSGSDARTLRIGSTIYFIYAKNTNAPFPEIYIPTMFKGEIAGDGSLTLGGETNLLPTICMIRGIWRVNDSRLLVEFQDFTASKEEIVLVDADNLTILDTYILPQNSLKSTEVSCESLDDTHFLFLFKVNSFGPTMTTFDISSDTLSPIHENARPSVNNGGVGALLHVSGFNYVLVTDDSSGTTGFRSVSIDENYHVSFGSTIAEPPMGGSDRHTYRNTAGNILVYYDEGAVRMAVMKLDIAAEQYEVMRDEVLLTTSNYHYPDVFFYENVLHIFTNEGRLELFKLSPAMSGGSGKPIGFTLAETASGDMCPVACGDIVPGFTGLTVGAKYGLDAYGTLIADAGGDYIALNTETIKYVGG